MRWTGLWIIMLAAQGAAPIAAQGAYQGRELQALHCADYFATAAIELEGELSDRERAELLTASALILSQHVSGSWAAKDAALKAHVAQRSMQEAVSAFRENRTSCETEFPVSIP